MFPEPSSVVEIGQNLFATITYGQSATEETSVLSLLLVTADSFFSGNARAKTMTLKGLRLMGIDVPCSAQEFLDGLKRQKEAPGMLATDTSEWTLAYGSTLKLTFSALSGVTDDPRSSRLDAVEYFYTSGFTGRLTPTLSVS